MNGILYWLMQNAVAAALLIPLVLLACRVFPHRPAVQHLLWLVVLVKFMTPPIVAWPWSIRDAQESLLHAWATMGTPSIAWNNHVPAPTSGFLFHPIDSTASMPTIQSVQLPVKNLQTDQTGRSWVQAVCWGLISVWLIGMVISLKRQLSAIQRYASIIGRGTPAPQPLTQLIEATAEQMGLRAPRAVSISGIQSPFVWCLGRLVLVWPESLSNLFDLQRARGVIAHELAHVQRRDHWIAWLELVAGVIWWWNPLLWFVRCRLHESAELSCDAIALTICSDQRRTYAELLLALASNSEIETPATALGVSSHASAFFEHRLLMILSDRVTGALSSSGVLAVICVSLIALPTWTLAQHPAFKPSDKLAAARQPRASIHNQRGQADVDDNPQSKQFNTFGRVVDVNDRRIAGARLWWVAFFKNGKHVVFEGTTNEHGRFSLLLPEGPLPDATQRFDTLWVFKEGKQLAAVSANSGLHIGIAEATETLVRLEEPAGDTSFTVVGPDNAPLSGLKVEPWYFRSPLGYAIVPESARKLLTATTSVDGWINMPGLQRPALHALRVTSKTFGVQEFRLDTQAGAPLLRKLSLRYTGNIEGRLKADNPEWVKGVRLSFKTMSTWSDNHWTSAGIAEAVSDDEGHFVAHGIATGIIRIDIAHAPDSSALPQAPESIVIEDGDTTKLDITYAPAVLVRGSIRTADTNKPVPGAEISVRYGVGGQGSLVKSDAEGRYQAWILAGKVSTQVIARPIEFNDYEQTDEGWRDRFDVPRGPAQFELPPIRLSRTRQEEGLGF